MKVGMLWQDNDERRTLVEKVTRAADYYRTKYGALPTVCYVHPSMLPAGEDVAGQIRVLTDHTVQVHHLWLGASAATEGAPERSRAGGRS